MVGGLGGNGMVGGLGGSGMVGGLGGNGMVGGTGGGVPGLPVGNLANLARNNAFGVTPLRRMTRTELRNSLVEAFGVNPGQALMDQAPEDVIGGINFPYPNDYTKQAVNDVVIEKYSAFADGYSLLVATPAQVKALAGCTPTGPGDTACFQSLAAKVALKAFRRPVPAAEVQTFTSTFMPYAAQDNDFYVAARYLVQALVQAPTFLYRIEPITKPAGSAGVFQLGDYEIATRMAFLVWGGGPDDALLAAAQAGLLKSDAERLKQLGRMLQSPKALAQWQYFHSLWLSYEGGTTLPPALAADMVAETNNLVGNILGMGKPWASLFTSDETFVSPALAKHYGLPGPASAGAPVKYTGTRGGGVLAHATMLVHGSKFGDTSPTLRGNEILMKLMCTELPPPPTTVDTDIAPVGKSPTACKPERYEMRTLPDCKSCHLPLDDMGFGLENFSATGQWRTTEPGLSNCAITGAGSVFGQPFTGPRELGQLLAQRPEIGACASLQMFRFMSGRIEAPSDDLTAKALAEQLRTNGTLISLLEAVVKSPAIGFKVTQ
jgi:hypothetical protein